MLSVKIPAGTHFDVVFHRAPDVVTRRVVGGAGSHVCAGEVSGFFWMTVFALISLEESLLIL